MRKIIIGFVIGCCLFNVAIASESKQKDLLPLDRLTCYLGEKIIYSGEGLVKKIDKYHVEIFNTSGEFVYIPGNCLIVTSNLFADWIG